MADKWNNAELYESFVGRWSRNVAAVFLNWINRGKDLVWLDVGCGTGALTRAILNQQHPGKVIGIDSSEEHIKFLRENISDSRAEFFSCDASSILIEDETVDVIVSGLVLNFINDITGALNEFKRIARSGACISAYVWDYAGKMEMLRYFFDAAVSLFDDAYEKDEGVRFKICNPDSLRNLFISAGFKKVNVKYIDINSVFKDFDDYWTPFLSGVGPAPGYCMSLSEEKRTLLKERIHSSLPIEKDGSIKLTARAIAVRGVK